MAEQQPQQLRIRFRGICGHVSIPGTKKKRTVLVRHNNGNANMEHHIPYIEFYADDVASSSPSLKLVQYSRLGVEGRFARIDLENGTQIQLKGIDPGDVDEQPNYQTDVPHMSEILKKAVAARPGIVDVSPQLLGDGKDAARARTVAAFFDMPAGILLAGEPEGMITRFGDDVGFEARRFAKWTELYVPYKTPQIVVQLTAAGETREITFKNTLRMLTIGNEPERVILGLKVGGGPKGGDHFGLYYDLLDDQQNLPDPRPLPIPTMLEGAGCPNNAYP